MMKRRKNTIATNKLVMFGIFALFLLIIWRLIFISFFESINGQSLEIFASNRNTVTETLYAKRGTIYDTNGDILGESVNSYTVIAYLEKSRTNDLENPQHVTDVAKTAEELSPILNMTVEYLIELLSKDLYQVELGPGGRGISELTKEQIEDLDLPGISFVSGTKRFYKMGNLAPYSIGYARMNNDGKIIGEMGIENYYNNILTGSDGYRIYEQDAYGYSIPETEVTIETPSAGNDIYLTLDSNIQLYTENAVNSIVKEADASWVNIVIMNGKTGEILSSASDPTFNLNELNIENYLNPLTSYTFEPGSTMKIFSYMSAMEEGIYNGDELYQSGTVQVDDATIKEFNNVGWGTISYDEGFTRSSNVATTNLALEMGGETLRNYYSLLGFGTETGITLPGEASGDIGFKYNTEIATASFGQGITITPVQMMQALSFLTNDGTVVKPQIVDKIVDSETGEVIEDYTREELGQVASKETTDELIELMREVVTTKRTDAFVYEPDSVDIIGKTGTAQIAGNGGYLTGSTDYIRSFAGVFPYDDPEYIIYIAVKQYQGSISTVGAAAADLIAEVAKYENVENAPTEELPSNIIDISTYYGEPTTEVVNELAAKKINPIVIGDGEIIVDNYPKNQKLEVGNKIFIITNSNNIAMPDITGWSRNEVSTYCNLILLQCTFTGYGNVTDFNIPAGELIDRTKILNVKLN